MQLSVRSLKLEHSRIPAPHAIWNAIRRWKTMDFNMVCRPQVRPCVRILGTEDCLVHIFVLSIWTKQGQRHRGLPSSQSVAAVGLLKTSSQVVGTHRTAPVAFLLPLRDTAPIAHCSSDLRSYAPFCMLQANTSVKTIEGHCEHSIPLPVPA